MESTDFISMNKLSLKLKPVFIGQLLVVDSLIEPAYSFENGIFNKVIEASKKIEQSFLSFYGANVSSKIFVSFEDFNRVTDIITDELLKSTRSLSIGDPLRNAMKQTHLLSLQMSNLYNDPYNDEILNSQFRSSKSLGSFLLENKSVHKALYNNITKQGHHYTIAQPLLSSILLLSFMQQLGSFNEKEIQTLFSVSYFRDIGMSLIPSNKYEIKDLSRSDIANFKNHGKYSVDILKNRININLNYLNLIGDHHFLTADNKSTVNLVVGVESTIFCIVDMLVAMISKRPYREELSLFEALGYIKELMLDEYPHEYKALVIYLKKFYS